MNFSSLTGVVIALVVFVGSLLTATKSHEIFLDPHAILIVLGGTLAAAFICFPIKTLFLLVRVFFKKILGKYALTHSIIIAECTELARGYRQDAGFLAKQVGTLKTPFLMDCIQLLADGGLPEESLDAIMEKRADTHSKRYEEEADIFKTLAKFPPAFGLMATTLGMIALLQQMGGPDSYKSLGPSMAIGLVGTLYGLLLANFVFIPLGENLSRLNREDEVARMMVLDAVKLIRRKAHPLIVEETLVSYLLPKERKLLTRTGTPTLKKAEAA